jgi:hypothetical protein
MLFIIKSIAGIIIAHTFIEACHMNNFFPEKELADVINLNKDFILCFLVLIIAIFLLFIERWIHKINWSWFKKVSKVKKANTNRIPLSQFLKIAENQGIKLTDPNSQLLNFTYLIKQAGFDGDLHFFGREFKNHMFQQLQDKEVLKPIPKEHWEDFMIDGTSCLDTDNRGFSVSIKENNQSNNSYVMSSHKKGFTDIHLEKESALKWLKTQKFDKKNNKISEKILDVIAKYNQITADYVYNPHYPKTKTQENQNNLEIDFNKLLALKEVMLDNKLERYLKDIRQRIAIIFNHAMSLEFDENELRKKRMHGAISNREYNQEMPELHNDFLKHKEIIINYLKQ